MHPTAGERNIESEHFFSSKPVTSQRAPPVGLAPTALCCDSQRNKTAKGPTHADVTEGSGILHWGGVPPPTPFSVQHRAAAGTTAGCSEQLGHVSVKKDSTALLTSIEAVIKEPQALGKVRRIPTWKSSMRCSLRLELGLGTRSTRNSARNRLVLFFSAEDTLKRNTLEVTPLGQMPNSSGRKTEGKTENLRPEVRDLK